MDSLMAFASSISLSWFTIRSWSETYASTILSTITSDPSKMEKREFFMSS